MQKYVNSLTGKLCLFMIFIEQGEVVQLFGTMNNQQKSIRHKNYNYVCNYSLVGMLIIRASPKTVSLSSVPVLMPLSYIYHNIT